MGLETPLARAAPSAASSVAADALGKVVARGADAGPTVRGRIVGETGTPVQGAIVRIAELDVEASTDSSGRYVLTVPADSLLKPVTLTARRLGFRAATRMIPEVGERGRTEDFRLRPEGIRLEDVVVTGAAADQTAFRPVEFLDAVALLGGTIRLIDGLIPTGLEAARNDVRVVYRIGGREVHLTQRREGGAVTFTLSGPPDFPADSLALLRARVRE